MCTTSFSVDCISIFMLHGATYGQPHCFVSGPKDRVQFSIGLQLNEYETAPYFCVFPRSYLNLSVLSQKLFSILKQNNFYGAKQVNSGKNGEKHKSKQTISCHVLAELKKNMDLSHIQ